MDNTPVLPTKDAIIFIPGLGDWVDQSADDIARRIAIALDRDAKTAGAKFSVQTQGREEDYGRSPESNYQTRVATIQRFDGKQPGPGIDVYALNYNTSLNKNYTDQNLIIKTLRLFLGILTALPRLLLAPFRDERAKTLSELFQFSFAILILTLLIVYMALLVVAVYDLVVHSPQFTQAISTISQPVPTPTPTTSAPAGSSTSSTGQPEASQLAEPLTFSQVVIILFAIIEVFIPNLKTQVSRLAVDYISVIDYLSIGERRQSIAGQFADLLEHIAENGIYRRIHIVAFSFGSVIAMDSLFPYGETPSERFRLVDTLVTIGNPFDLIRQFWPGYFTQRESWPGVPCQWLNVYSPIDILSSNFRNDNKQMEADKSVRLLDTRVVSTLPKNLVYTRGVDPRQLSPLSWITLLGLRAHTMYWEAQEDSDMNCFKIITDCMYVGEPLLA